MDFEQNTHIDIAFSRDVMNKEERVTEQPVTLIADGAYDSDELVGMSDEKKVRLVQHP